MKKAAGKAKATDIPGKFKVSFFLFFYADYLVLELDHENYQWALVGSSSSNYLWILSRTPDISSELYASIVEKAKKKEVTMFQNYSVYLNPISTINNKFISLTSLLSKIFLGLQIIY